MSIGLRSLSTALFFLVFALVCAAPCVEAQARPSATNLTVPTSKIDLYGGYAYWHPWDADIHGTQFQPINTGAVVSATVYLNHWLGIQAEGGIHPHGDNDCFASAEGGIIVRHAMGRFVPFAHAVGGGVKLGGPVLNPCTWGWGGTAGIGTDYVLHGWNEHLAIRLFQADYQYNYVDFGQLVLPGAFSGGTAKMNTIRASAGIVLRFGQSTDAQKAQLACEASPRKIFAGDPVTLSGSTLYIDIHKPAQYAWQTTGGTISGKGDSVTIGTAGLAPGTYTVQGSVQQGRGALHRATCTTDFDVQADEPPTITCSANPASVHPGESTTITASGVSPQNRALSYNFTSSAGQISSNGNIATLETSTLPAGDVTVTCNTTDDRGKTASATTMVNIAKPAAPPTPVMRALCTASFENDKRRPARVDNEAKGCLDDVALVLQRENDSTLVLVGEYSSNEGAPVASERAANVKQYLVAEKGIDTARIQIRASTVSGPRATEIMLIPIGASFTGDKTVGVDAATVIHHGQPYGKGTGSLHYPVPATNKTKRHHPAKPKTAQPATGTSK